MCLGRYCLHSSGIHINQCSSKYCRIADEEGIISASSVEKRLRLRSMSPRPFSMNMTGLWISLSCNKRSCVIQTISSGKTLASGGPLHQMMMLFDSAAKFPPKSFYGDTARGIKVSCVSVSARSNTRLTNALFRHRERSSNGPQKLLSRRSCRNGESAIH